MRFELRQSDWQVYNLGLIVSSENLLLNTVFTKPFSLASLVGVSWVVLGVLYLNRKQTPAKKTHFNWSFSVTESSQFGS